MTCRIKFWSSPQHWVQFMSYHIDDIRLAFKCVAMIMAATPECNSVVWVRVAEDAKNYWAIALPVTIIFYISWLENALNGKKNGRG